MVNAWYGSIASLVGLIWFYSYNDFTIGPVMAVLETDVPGLISIMQFIAALTLNQLLTSLSLSISCTQQNQNKILKKKTLSNNPKMHTDIPKCCRYTCTICCTHEWQYSSEY